MINDSDIDQDHSHNANGELADLIPVKYKGTEVRVPADFPHISLLKTPPTTTGDNTHWSRFMSAVISSISPCVNRFLDQILGFKKNHHNLEYPAINQHEKTTTSSNLKFPTGSRSHSHD